MAEAEFIFFFKIEFRQASGKRFSGKGPIFIPIFEINRFPYAKSYQAQHL
jgi:hypothetical protein